MNENDENGPSTRMTRAKAAAFTADGPTDAAKKPLQTKRTTATGNGSRTRAALGDVSNVNKADAGDIKDGKKAGKAGLTSKAAVSTGGIQKPRRAASTRSALGTRDATAKKSGSEIKRNGSGSGSIKRSSKSVKEDYSHAEEPPRKKPHTHQKSLEEKPQHVVEEKVAVETRTKEAFEAGVPDLDEEDIDDPLMVAEYVVEIFDYLKDLELVTLPNPQYIDHQPDLEWKMRGILVDWLIEVHTRFRLLPETLFLAVNIIDRFLSAEVVALDRLQLVGVTAMFIASKYEEVLSPHVANFSHVADETFSDKEILDAERHVLATLEYNLSYPNPMNFLRRISKADNYDIQTRTLGKYLLEISLLDHRFLGYPQSQIAAAAMYLARLILERGSWDNTLAHYAGYTEKEIDPVFRLMIDYLHRPVSHEAFFKKYASKKFLKGKSSLSSPAHLDFANSPSTASILTRQWAKKYHHMYIDSSVSEPYTYIKDEQ